MSRIALIFLLVFYTAYETSVGIGTGILVDYANGLPGAAAVFAIHPPPTGPIGLVCFAATFVLVERARARPPDVLVSS
ncbi:MAG: hypothetical protein ACXW0R_08750 [Gaiellaceae bacterium]